MSAKCFWQVSDSWNILAFLSRSCLAIFSVIKHPVPCCPVTESKVLKCNLPLVIFYLKTLWLGVYLIPTFHWFISIKNPHVQASQLAAVTIDSHPQGLVPGFKVDHWEFHISSLRQNGNWGQQEPSSPEPTHNSHFSNYRYSIFIKQLLFCECQNHSHFSSSQYQHRKKIKINI